MADSKRIAKNTMFLYIRMLFIMGVTLYTSRVVLDKLGVDDFGLYNVVGGIVGMLAFLNGTLSNGTSRFLTFELGTGDKQRIKTTFSTALYSHIALAILLILLLETGGMWYVYNKLVVEASRFEAAVIVFQISILSSLISIIQVPFTSLIIAHEDMGVYAYVGIFDAIARLFAVFLLSVAPFDKLILYALLMMMIYLLVMLLYCVYCFKHYEETTLRFTYDKQIFRSILGFSGWNIIAHLSETLKMQGYLILLNLFFQPFVVAAQTIGNQVAGAMMQFINNFRQAVTPQIIKSYAAGEYEESKRLTMQTTILTFDLVLLLGLPSILVMEILMKLWLVDVPQYAVVFTQFIIVQRIVGTFDASFYTPMTAAAKIKTNSLIGGIISIGLFVFLYFVFRCGGDVMWLQYSGVIITACYGVFVKPAILIKEVVGYSYKDFLPCYTICGLVAGISIALSFGAYKVIGNETLIQAMMLFFASISFVGFSSYLFLDKNTKKVIRSTLLKCVKSKICILR